MESSHEVQNSDFSLNLGQPADPSLNPEEPADPPLNPEQQAPPSLKLDLPEEPSLNLNLHFYGLSYHTDREGVRRSRVDNELNVGIGVGYEFHNDDQGAAFFQAGLYKDSGRNWAKVAGPGYQFKLGDRWRIGAALLVIESRTYNNGNIFVAPIPILTYDLGIVKLNAAFAPRFRDLNEFAVFGFYFSIPLKN